MGKNLRVGLLPGINQLPFPGCWDIRYLLKDHEGPSALPSVVAKPSDHHLVTKFHDLKGGDLPGKGWLEGKLISWNYSMISDSWRSFGLSHFTFSGDVTGRCTDRLVLRRGCQVLSVANHPAPPGVQLLRPSSGIFDLYYSVIICPKTNNRSTQEYEAKWLRYATPKQRLDHGRVFPLGLSHGIGATSL